MTNTAQHTPGPWIYKDEQGIMLGGQSDWSAQMDCKSTYGVQSTAPVMDNRGTTIAIVVLDGFDENIIEANARLIAAAPDLLAALEYCAGQLADSRMIGDDDGLRGYLMAQDAIAKATGKEGA